MPTSFIFTLQVLQILLVANSFIGIVDRDSLEPFKDLVDLLLDGRTLLGALRLSRYLVDEWKRQKLARRQKGVR